jgi:hypothetical protein
VRLVRPTSAQLRDAPSAEHHEHCRAPRAISAEPNEFCWSCGRLKRRCFLPRLIGTQLKGMRTDLTVEMVRAGCDATQVTGHRAGLPSPGLAMSTSRSGLGRTRFEYLCSYRSSRWTGRNRRRLKVALSTCVVLVDSLFRFRSRRQLDGLSESS